MRLTRLLPIVTVKTQPHIKDQRPYTSLFRSASLHVIISNPTSPIVSLKGSTFKHFHTMFGHNTTSDEIMAKHGAQAKGKVIIITGANSGSFKHVYYLGIGLETSRALASGGAQVILCSRKVENGEAACAKIKETVPDANISTMAMDLNSLASIETFANAFLAKYDRLDILINNAGIMACPEALTKDGIESQFGVCHVGHFHLTSLLLPLLIKSGTKAIPSYLLYL
jgi:hypothetical protein